MSVVGQGKLGTAAGVVFAEAGHKVTGIDINEQVINTLKRGECHIVEPDLRESLVRCNGNLDFDTSFDSTRFSDVIVIIVPTPSQDDFTFSNKYILSAIENLQLKDRQDYFVVVVTSTIMPGSMRHVIAPALEKQVGRKVGDNYGLCYVPEFIALGSVIRNMKHPDAVLIGESDWKAGSVITELQRSVTGNHIQYSTGGCPVVRTSWENAEIAKIALNAYITMKISFVNLLAQVCDCQENANVDEVTKFLGFDARIKPKCLTGGLSFGGTCFPRDTRAFATLVPYDKSIPYTIHEFNLNHIDYVAQRIGAQLPAKSNIAILGTSFKPNTPVTECSASLGIGKYLESNHNVRYFDPQGYKTGSLREVLENADMAVLATPWQELIDIDIDMMLKYMRTSRVYDCWRMWDRKKFEAKGFDYVALGVSY